MKSYLSLLWLIAGTVSANTTPIEPVMVPVKYKHNGTTMQMGKYEITNEEYSRFIASTGYQVPQKCMLFSPSSWPNPEKPANWDHPELIDNSFKPVSCIGVKGAMAYAEWLSEVTGKPYRLPRKEEWEYAASPGKHSRFDFGEDYAQTEICKYENTEDFASVAGILRDHGHRYESSAQCNDGAVYQTVVGMYRPNSSGLHDMMGNVRELLQSCFKWDEKQPDICLEYDVAGEAWHWQARRVSNPDSILADFHGSIEGFRLILDSPTPPPISAETKLFIKNLEETQQQARIQQAKMLALPEAPMHVRASLKSDHQIQIEWQSAQSQDVYYSIYRSYLDSKGELSRGWEKVADNIKTNTYLDTLPGNDLVKYKVYANNTAGESPSSHHAQLGKAPVFTVGQKIEAEHFLAEKRSWVQEKDGNTVIGLADNERHYATGQIPFLPAWLTFAFNTPKEGNGVVEINVKGEAGAAIEIWQGHHLVARMTLPEQSDFVKISHPASWIKGIYPLEIRAANQKWVMVDWLQLTP